MKLNINIKTDENILVWQLAYEDLNKTDRIKYEYILPNLVYERNLLSNEKIGIIDLYTNAIGKNYNVNQTTKFLVNDFGWKSRSFTNTIGIQSNFEGLLKVVAYEAENTSNFKNEEFNVETYGASHTMLVCRCLKRIKTKLVF